MGSLEPEPLGVAGKKVVTVAEEILSYFKFFNPQSKVQQLYHIDQLLQEESGTLQSLQRDKEDLERALGSLKAKIMKADTPPMAIEAARQQQHALERELSRVHLLLAENSKVRSSPNPKNHPLTSIVLFPFRNWRRLSPTMLGWSKNCWSLDKSCKLRGTPKDR